MKGGVYRMLTFIPPVPAGISLKKESVGLLVLSQLRVWTPSLLIKRHPTLNHPYVEVYIHGKHERLYRLS